ncbi:MAG: hypothetical protein RMJ81_07935 [Candidatus Kryptonium sp.]|nr:hypothetical protein [Candidatus Kryptonium sp.]
MLFILIFLIVSSTFSQNANDVINKAIQAVEANDKKIETLSGEFKLKVLMNYDMTVRKGNYEFLYDVKFENGEIKERKLVSIPEKADSQSIAVAKRIERVRQGENLKIKNLVFPFIRWTENSSDKKINFKLKGSEKLNGKDCYVITVDFKVKNDSISSNGDGKIWVEKDSHFPIRCEYDVTYESKRAGKNQSKQFLDIADHGDFYLPIRNEIQFFPRVLLLKLGTVKIVYETNKFTFKK